MVQVAAVESTMALAAELYTLDSVCPAGIGSTRVYSMVTAAAFNSFEIEVEAEVEVEVEAEVEVEVEVAC